ncbi:SDR family NAD(P)-dependent oxidoreductase [Streptomyces sp. PLK6-54]|uniref:SDR family NAD(P)-dependent oxidoreductase n=2 Tax=Actinacidiphila acidipaludis TaxID=2873382 RepID=A0ABS7QIQ9_9ACTN|nr:SDR family NAD(P)-dependent oxidoreductase [Streptomyces acidipaludis]MBY8882300.1 SDR family NAD(P)-dependent oxidoreductase [Streptomyces acidipaludis]
MTPSPLFRSRPDKGPLTGLSAVVTGGSRGLGLLLAEQLLRRGCAVTVAARDEEELDRAREFLLRQRPGGRVRTAVCDVTDRAAVAALMGGAADAFGGIDVVVANAGVIQVAPVESVGSDEFRSAMDTIYLGAVHAALEALPWLRRSRPGGRLALIGSVGGLLAVPHLLPYSAAKSAVAALAEGLHAELRGDRVSVTAVHPGLMRTGSHLAAEFGGDQAAEFAWFSALAGAPLVSMDARRAADRIVTAVERRRPRIVLTPLAKAAGLTHGIAPALTTRLSALAVKVLPAPPGSGNVVALHKGHAVEGTAERELHPVLRRLRGWGSTLNDRAARRLNQRTRPAAGGH